MDWGVRGPVVASRTGPHYPLMSRDVRVGSRRAVRGSFCPVPGMAWVRRPRVFAGGIEDIGAGTCRIICRKGLISEAVSDIMVTGKSNI